MSQTKDVIHRRRTTGCFSENWTDKMICDFLSDTIVKYNHLLNVEMMRLTKNEETPNNIDDTSFIDGIQKHALTIVCILDLYECRFHKSVRTSLRDGLGARLKIARSDFDDLLIDLNVSDYYSKRGELFVKLGSTNDPSARTCFEHAIWNLGNEFSSNCWLSASDALTNLLRVHEDLIMALKSVDQVEQ